MTVTAADRDRLVRGSYASAAEVAAVAVAMIEVVDQVDEQTVFDQKRWERS